MNKIISVLIGVILACWTTVVQAQELKSKEIRGIAEKYREAILDKDYQTWSSLMADTKGITETDFLSYFNLDQRNSQSEFLFVNNGIRKIKVGKIKNNSIRLRIIDGRQYEREVVLLLLPDGKIKYDAIFVRHPIFIAYWFTRSLSIDIASNNKGGDDEERRILSETGIPMFGYDPEASDHQQYQALLNIKEWMGENGDKWDKSDPKLFLSKNLVSSMLDNELF